MKKLMYRSLSAVLTLCLMCCMAVGAFAAEIGESGGAGTTPVNLTTTNGGIGGEGVSVTPTRLSVSVPTALPMAMADNGAVVTSTGCKIVNWSYGAVRVAGVSITAVNGWQLTAFGDKSILAGEKVDSNKIGFALSIGGGRQVQTDNSDPNTQHLVTAPMTGCYLTGSGNVQGSTAAIEYAAIITPMSRPVRNMTVANVVIVVEWDTED